MKTTLALFAFFCLANLAGAAEQPKAISKTSRKKFDLPKEVVAFVSHLIENDPEVRARYEKLIAKTQEEAGGRFSTASFVAIEWLVPNFVNDFGGEHSTRDGEYVYLVQQQLRFGFHHGYSVEDNVVARVHVKIHEDYKPDSTKPGDNFALTGNKLDLVFEGFVDVALTPK